MRGCETVCVCVSACVRTRVCVRACVRVYGCGGGGGMKYVMHY